MCSCSVWGVTSLPEAPSPTAADAAGVGALDRIVAGEGGGLGPLVPVHVLLGEAVVAAGLDLRAVLLAGEEDVDLLLRHAVIALEGLVQDGLDLALLAGPEPLVLLVVHDGRREAKTEERDEGAKGAGSCHVSVFLLNYIIPK